MLDPVGADDKIVAASLSIAEAGRHPAVALLELADRHSQPHTHPRALHCPGQDAVECRTRKHVDGWPVRIGNSQEAQLRDQAAVGVKVSVFIGLEPGGKALVEDTDGLQRPQRIPRLKNPDAMNLVRRLDLHDFGFDPPLTESRSQRQSANAGTDDENIVHRHWLGIASRSVSSARGRPPSPPSPTSRCPCADRHRTRRGSSPAVRRPACPTPPSRRGG